MRLLSITLHDVRRFADTVRLEGMGPGVNVLTAPNEQGKSTLFDALQALFFQPHRSQAREVRSLRPHAGGAPTVSVEIETGNGRFRITKRWLSRSMAEVRQDAQLVAKADAAEDWIAAQVRTDQHGGPAGLLWVRQGVTALDGDEKAEKSAQLARRGLLSSVAGEVEAMTGGRRMERALIRCAAELGELVTGTGRAKAGGPLKAAEDEIAGLERQHTELKRLSEELANALDERRRLRSEVAELRDPEQAQAARKRLEEAREGRDEAKRHAERIAQAEERVEGARKARDHALDRLTALQKVRKALSDAERQEINAGTAEAEARQVTDEKTAARKSASAALADARKAAAAAERSLAELATAERAAEARRLRETLSRQFEEARTWHAKVIEARTAAEKGPKDKTLAALEEAVNELRVQEALREQSAPRFTMRYDNAETPRKARVKDGPTLEHDRATPLPEGGEIELPGLGMLAVDPGKRAGAEDGIRTARAALEERLAEIGAATPGEARTQAAARRQAETTRREMGAALAAVAPDGIAALEAELAALGDHQDNPDSSETPLSDRKELESKAAEARAGVDAAGGAVEHATALARSAEIALARATAEREAAERGLDAARRELAEIAEPEAEEAMRSKGLADAKTFLEKVEATVTDLAKSAPDLDAVEAAFRRAESVLQLNETRLRELSRRLTELDTLIELRAGEGVEEDLAEVTERLARARERLDQLSFERDMLNLLGAELDAARTAAREHYFEPVTRELRPLLRILWHDAELSFDDAKVLPIALTRNGQEEPIDVLSGGTREQIALLVRLAFARLLARGGRPAPVILDDALVYTDDDRIERMFDALHRQAGDMQILVLSCRQRAFRALGGSALSFAPGALPEEAVA